jgi:hypothetical protein
MAGSGGSSDHYERNLGSYGEAASRDDDYLERRRAEESQARELERRQAAESDRKRKAELQREKNAAEARAREIERERREAAARTEAERAARLREKRDDSNEAPRADYEALYDATQVRRHITKPHPQATDIYIFLVDISGSNQLIAQKIRTAGAYLVAFLKVLNPRIQIAFVFFSDHCDGELIRQDIDYVFPDQEGLIILASTSPQIKQAFGGDDPEAIECVMKEAAGFDFGQVPRRHLVLVSDQVAHYMDPLTRDDGCPYGQRWEDSLAAAREVYTSIKVIGCGGDQRVSRIQQQFLKPERVAFDFIDLSEIRNPEHRKAITVNAMLFIIARDLGFQRVAMFLKALYEKWLSEPIFGQATDLNAREAIARFAKFIEKPQAEIDAMLKDIFAVG